MSYRSIIVPQRMSIPRPIDEVGVMPYLALSFRRLRGAYTGNLLRIRRESDSVEQSIGQRPDVLDRQAAKTFLGTSHGYMVQWFDQSTNETDFVQNTASEQPFVADTGVVLSSAGLNRARLTNDRMSVIQGGQAQPTTTIICATPINHTAGAVLVGGGSSSSGYDFGQSASGTLPFLDAGSSVNGTNSVAVGQRHILAWRIDGSSSTIFVDGNEDTGLAAGSNDPLGLTLGSDESGANFADFYIHELMYFTSALSAGVLDALVKNMNAYYKVY